MAVTMNLYIWNKLSDLVAISAAFQSGGLGSEHLIYGGVLN